MKNFLIELINLIVKPFAGKGIIDKYFPFLLHLYENIYSKLQPDEYETVSIPNNLKLRVSKKDSHIGNLLINKGEFEPLETLEFIKSLTPTSVVFDVGANFGYYSVIAGSVAKQGKVYAFEPDKQNFVEVGYNVGLNNLNNVVIENLGVGNKIGNFSFQPDSVHRGRSRFVENAGEYSVSVVTLDSYCNENAIYNIDILKIDVEGFETDVLKGARRIIQNSKDIKLFIEYNIETLKERGLNSTDFFNSLSECKLIPMLIIDETKKQIIEFNQANLQNVLSHSTYCNLVCTH